MNSHNAPVTGTKKGIRMYKIVILGDGGVGKSGEVELDDVSPN